MQDFLESLGDLEVSESVFVLANLCDIRQKEGRLVPPI
jgi:hypothetical protein